MLSEVPIREGASPSARANHSEGELARPLVGPAAIVGGVYVNRIRNRAASGSTAQPGHPVSA